MKPITLEWIRKAEGDFATAEREMKACPSPNYDAVAFHAQQCAEKYLKARLVEAGQPFPKVHDLTAILNVVLALESAWISLRSDLNVLTDLGVEVRYPGIFADQEDAACALQSVRRIRERVRESFGLKDA